MTYRYVALAALLWASVLAGPVGTAQAQNRQPYSLDQLIEIIESGVFSDSRILFLVRENCLGFQLDDEAALRLQRAGASAGLVSALRDQCVRLPQIVASVTITPREVELPTGGSRILRAHALGPDSTEIPDVTFRWISEDTSVVDVAPDGLVMGLAPGDTRVIARSESGLAAAAQVRVVAATEPDSLAVERRAGKSVATAATLGVLLPGGGEFYTGNGVKGAVVLAGAAASLAAGYLITSDEIVGRTLDPDTPPLCDETGSCTFSGDIAVRVKETRQIVIGAAAAGAFWLYGLVDGIRSARAPRSSAAPAGTPVSGLSLQLLPADGVRFSLHDGLELTLLTVYR